jgi:hypothetical protein
MSSSIHANDPSTPTTDWTLHNDHIESVIARIARNLKVAPTDSVSLSTPGGHRTDLSPPPAEVADEASASASATQAAATIRRDVSASNVHASASLRSLAQSAASR